MSAYLLVRTFALMDGRSADAFDVCSSVFGTGCDDTLADMSTWLLGVPLAGWGLVHFAALATLLLLPRIAGRDLVGATHGAAFALAAAGAVGSAVLTASIVAGLAPFCPMCLVVHAASISLPIALTGASRAGAAESLGRLRAGAAWVLGKGAPGDTHARNGALALACVALFAIAAYQWVLVEVVRRQEGTGFNAAKTIESFDAEPVHDIPRDDDRPVSGPPDAKARLVVFSGFQCVGCAQVAPFLTELREHFGADLAIEFRHYPISTACNPHAAIDRHARACPSALAGVAAQRQGRFWEFHDALFAAESDLTEDDLVAAAAAAGLDRAQFDADRASDAALAVIRADTDLARQLLVSATPTVFLNGRVVRELATDSLEVLVHHALDTAPE